MPKSGEEIIKKILAGSLIFDESIAPYVKAFAYVYYWIGNMMPVVSNPIGLGDRGTWRNKLLFLKGDKEETNLVVAWGGDKWELPNDWINSFYFQDAIISDNNNETVKPFYEELDGVEQVFFSIGEGFDQKMWFLNNVKLIIQRSYRIEKQFMGDKWSEENVELGISHEECVKKIMKIIFDVAGFEDISEDKITLF